MKTVKIAIVMLLIFSLGLSMVACAISKEDVVGTWKGSWNYNGYRYSKTLVLKSDGSYSFDLNRDGRLYDDETGLYEVDGNKVTLYPHYGNGKTVYTYDDDKLVSGETLSKVR